MNEQMRYTVTSISGIFLGLLLYGSWIVFLFIFSTIFFVEKDAVTGTEVVRVIALNQVFDWIMAGPIPLLLTLGHYITTRDQKDVDWMKLSLLGFSIWLAVLGIASLAGLILPFKLNLTGGYSLMLLILLIKRIKTRLH